MACGASMRESALLPLPILLLLALSWSALWALSRARWIRARWPEASGDWVAVGALAALNLGFFWRVLLTRATWLPRGGGDFNSFYFPLYSFAARSISAGEFPLWNPHLWGGMPFAADQQTGVLAPLNLLAFAVARPFTYATLEMLAIGQVWLASVFTYAFSRDLGNRRAPALIAGVTFAYSGFLVSHLGHYPMVAVAAWLPVALLALRRALRGRSIAWTVAFSVAMLLALLGGHPQIFLYVLVAVWFYWAYLTATSSPAIEWPGAGSDGVHWLARPFAWHWFRAAGHLLLALVVTAGLAAPALLPSLELAGLSVRAGLSYQESTAFALRPLHLITLLLPRALGADPRTYIGALDFSGEVWGYAGVVALGLAILALVVPGARRGARFFAGLGLLALVLALGQFTPLQGWFFAFVPGFSRVRASGRWLLLVDFGVAMLAAYGADVLLRQIAAGPDATLRRLMRTAALALGATVAAGGTIALLLAGALLWPRDPSAPLAQFIDSLIGFLVVCAALMAGAIAIWRGRRLNVRYAMVALAGLVVLDLFSATASVPPTNTDPLTGYRHQEALTVLRSQPGPFRVDLTPMNEIWQPSWAALVGLDTVAGTYDPLGVARYAQYWDAIAKTPGQARYDLLNVRYAVTPVDKPAAASKFREIARGADYIIFENTQALPRAFLAGKTVHVGSGTAAWNAIAAADFDPRAVAYLEGGAPSFDTGAPNGTVAVTSMRSSALEVTVETERRAVLVISEVAYPGWRATIDGAATPIYTADYTFRAVVVPPGRHHVRLVFEPPLWRLGWLVAGVTLLALAIVAVARRAGRSRTAGRRAGQP